MPSVSTISQILREKSSTSWPVEISQNSLKEQALAKGLPDLVEQRPPTDDELVSTVDVEDKTGNVCNFILS